MKFHRLRIENINSLYDKQTIDFEGELSDTPLFLIMGPTGAGKTTILDCICLVLFGTTPRQQEVKGLSDIAEHIMSRGKGEASVTLEFSRRGEDGGRLRYRAGWYCNRAHKKASGNMQTPRRSLDYWSHETDSWESLATSTTQKEYEPYFDEALAGMTLEDFLRSVLLAQGAFTAFLEADPQKKADILEKLTSTEQYMSIGGRAMQRWQQAKSAVEEVENKMEGVSPMSDEEFEELRDEREELEEEAKEKAAERDELEARLDWLTKLGEIGERIDKAEKELKACRGEREEHADDFERLALAKRAQPAAKWLGERDRLDSELADLRDEVAERREKLEELEPDYEDAVSAVKKAREAFGAAKKQRSDMAEVLDEAKELYTRLATAREAAKEKKTAALEAEEKLDELEKELREQKSAHEKAVETRDAAREELEQLSAYAGIGEEFAGLEADVSSLEAALEQVQEQAARVEQHEDEHEETSEALAEVEAQLAEQDDELEPLEEALEEARAALEEQLDGAEGESERRRALRDGLDEAREERRALDKLAEGVAELREARAEVAARREELEAAEDALATAREAETAQRKAVEDAEEQVAARKEIVDARKDAARFVRERAQLAAGEECPLCGSTEHPWAGGDDDSDAVMTKLESAEEALEEAEATKAEREESLEKAREERVRLEQSLQNVGDRLEEASEQASEAERAVREGLDAYEVEADVDALDELESSVEGRAAGASERITELDDAQDALDAAAKAQQDAAEALQEAKELGSDLRERRRSLVQSKESLEKQMATAREALERRSEAFDEAAGELSERFEGVGIQVGAEVEGRAAALAGFVDALEQAGKRRDARKELVATLDELQDDVEKRKARIDSIEETQLPDRKETVERTEAAASDAVGEVDALREKTESVLDGEAPAEVEERLEEAVEEAEKGAKAAESKRDELKEKLTSLETELEDREERREKLREQRSKADDALAEELGELELDGVDELREAMLDDEALDELETTVSEIREAIAGAEATLKNAREELEAHRKRRPDNLDDEDDVDRLAEQVEAVEAEKSELDQQLGAKSEAIKTQERLRQKHAELADQLRERRRELGRWSRIHDLIGRNMGANFKEFAQALNLERIVHKANEHLEQLHDRYRLAVVKDAEGHPKLEFEVIDTHVANTARAISTLSGGETFLVSLALALALADFRQVRMPVETLLLDEGFGTLDQQSLDDAVSTLKTLHTREQRQVGVISHVERLQEEIQHRVVVRKLSGGRSEIEVETP